MKPTKIQIEKICKKLKTKLRNFFILDLGEHNINYVLNTLKGKFVLRIQNNPQTENLEREYKFLKKTKGKLGPKVFLLDKSKKILKKYYLIEEFLIGKHPTKVDNKFVISMAKWYKNLHSYKLKQAPKSLLKRSVIKRYQKYRKTLDPKFKRKFDELYKKSLEIFKENTDLISKRKTISINHGDPSKGNVFYTNGKVKLIDWEFVRYDYPESDLCFFNWSYNLNTKQKQLFLKTYKYSKSIKNLNLIWILHTWDMMTWRLKRFHLFKLKKLDKHQYPKSKKQALEDFEKSYKEISKAIKEF